MGLMNHLKGKSALAIILTVVLLIIVFGYGMRANRSCKGDFCFFGPKKTTNVETCQAETTAKPLEDVKAVR